MIDIDIQADLSKSNNELQNEVSSGATDRDRLLSVTREYEIKMKVLEGQLATENAASLASVTLIDSLHADIVRRFSSLLAFLYCSAQFQLQQSLNESRAREKDAETE